jgi:hypothetical protein
MRSYGKEAVINLPIVIRLRKIFEKIIVSSDSTENVCEQWKYRKLFATDGSEENVCQ